MSVGYSPILSMNHNGEMNWTGTISSAKETAVRFAQLGGGGSGALADECLIICEGSKVATVRVTGVVRVRAKKIENDGNAWKRIGQHS